jgi:hypothetical protein
MTQANGKVIKIAGEFEAHHDPQAGRKKCKNWKLHGIDQCVCGGCYYGVG